MTRAAASRVMRRGDPPGKPSGWEWLCYRCGAHLAAFGSDGLTLRADLRRLDGDRDGMPRWGVGRPGSEAQASDPTRRLPLWINCPACRAGQALEG
jgi:hypothetical protein